MSRIVDNARRSRGALAAAVVAAIALLPSPASAQPGVPAFCSNPLDLSCPVDRFFYDQMVTLIRPLWIVNRMMLLGSYYLDELRYQLVQNMFLGGYEQLLALATSVFAYVMLAALLLALLLVVVAPMFGASSPLSIPMIMATTVVAPVIFVGLAGIFGTVEQTRMEVSEQIYQATAASGGVEAFRDSIPSAPDAAAAARDQSMEPPAHLYPAEGDTLLCTRGGAVLTFPRRSGGAQGPRRSFRPDELAAAYLYADLVDIHCPYARYDLRTAVGFGDGYDPLVAPHKYFDTVAGGPAYLLTRDIGVYSWGSGDIARRQEAKASAAAGLTRMLIGTLMSFAALIYYLMQIVFTLAMVALFVAIPVGTLFGVFQKDWGWARDLLRRGGAILKTSWISSFLLGLLITALTATAQERNGTLFIGMGVLQIVVGVYLLMVSFQSLQSGVAALAGITGSALGAAAGTMGRATRVVTRTAMGAAGLAVGATAVAAGAGLGAAAMHTTYRTVAAAGGGRRTAALAALGRSRRVARAGEVARSIGLIGGARGEATTAALRIGQAAARGDREFRRALRGAKDEHVIGADGRPLKDADGRLIGGLDAVAFYEERARLRQQGQPADDAAVLAALGGRREREQEGRARGQRDAAAQREAAGRAYEEALLAQIGEAQAGRNVGGRIAEGAQALAAVAGRATGYAQDPTTAILSAAAAGRRALRQRGPRLARGAARGVAEARRSAGAIGRSVAGAGRGAQAALAPGRGYDRAWRLGEGGRLRAVTGHAAAPPEGTPREALDGREALRRMRAGATVRFYAGGAASVWGDAEADARTAARGPAEAPPALEEQGAAPEATARPGAPAERSSEQVAADAPADRGESVRQRTARLPAGDGRREGARAEVEAPRQEPARSDALALPDAQRQIGELEQAGPAAAERGRQHEERITGLVSDELAAAARPPTDRRGHPAPAPAPGRTAGHPLTDAAAGGPRDAAPAPAPAPARPRGRRRPPARFIGRGGQRPQRAADAPIQGYRGGRPGERPRAFSPPTRRTLAAEPLAQPPAPSPAPPAKADRAAPREGREGRDGPRRTKMRPARQRRRGRNDDPFVDLD